MASVDNRVVSMTFDNADFERRLANTIQSLDKLNKSISTAGAGTSKEFSNSLSTISDGISNISSKFSAFGAAAFTIVQGLTRSLVGMVTNFATQDVLGPIISGGKQRAINIEQAKFQFRGLGVDVDAMMASALKAVLGTAYGLDEAAKAAAQFAASGITAGAKMTESLRGIAGLAAMTGTSYSEMAMVMTSSAATGKITNMDLQQFATRGINVTATYAKAIGKTEAEVHAMASKGKIDYASFATAMDNAYGAHATKANETYTGSLANMHAAMSRLGATFFGPQQLQQRDLFNALTPVIDNVNSALQPLIKTFIEIRQTMSTNLINSLNKIDLSNFKLAIPNISQGLKNAYAGVTDILDVIKKAFRDVFPKSATSQIIAFSQAFEKLTAKLKMGAELGNNVHRIFAGFFSIVSIGKEIIKETIRFFVDLWKAFFPGSAVLDATVKFSDFIVKMREMLVQGGKIKEFFTSLGNFIKNPLKGLENMKTAIGEFISNIKNVKIPTNMPGFDFLDGLFGRIGQRIDQIKALGSAIADVFRWMAEKAAKVKEVLQPMLDYIKDWFKDLGSRLAGAMKKGDFNGAIDIINVGIIAGFGVLIGKLIKMKTTITGIFNFDFGGGAFKKIGGAFDELTGVLKAMQTDIKAGALLKIAIAIAVLTASVLVLSLIDSAALTKALTAMTVGFGQLIGSMMVMMKMSSNPKDVAMLAALSVVMNLVAGALVVLSLAVFGFSRMKPEELAVGLAGITATLIVLAGAAKLMDENNAPMLRASVAMIAVGMALNVIALAVKQFSTLSWEELGRGLAGVAGGLLAIAGGMALMPGGIKMSIQAVALVEVAIALNILALAVKQFSMLSWEELGRGLVGVGGGLIAVGYGMGFMPLSMPFTALALVAVGIALNLIALAVKQFASMTWAEMGQGLVGVAGGLILIGIGMGFMPLTLPITAIGLLAVSVSLNIMALALKSFAELNYREMAIGFTAMGGSLTILAIATNNMTESIPGAIAVTLVAASLMILYGVIKNFSKLKPTELAMGLAGIGSTLLTVGLVMNILSASAPGMIAFGGAMVLIAGAFMLFAAGALFLVKAFDILANTLKTLSQISGDSMAQVKQNLQVLVSMIPDLVKPFAEGIIELAKTILVASPVLIEMLGIVIEKLITEAIKLLPSFFVMVTIFITDLLQLIRDKAPDLIATGMFVIVSFLQGIKDNIYQITTLIVDIITGFIDGVTAKVPQIIDSVYDLIVAVVKGVVAKLVDIGKELLPIGKDLIGGLLGGITDAIGSVISWFTELPGKILGWIGNLISTILSPKGAELIAGFYAGIGKGILAVVTWFAGLPGKILGWIVNLGGLLFSKGVDLIDGVLKGLGAGVLSIAFWFIDLPGKIIGWIGNVGNKLMSIGGAIISGILKGLGNGVWQIWAWITSFADNLPWWLKKALGIDSPSKVMMEVAKWIPAGILKALEDDNTVEAGIYNLGDRTTTALQQALSTIPVMLSNISEFTPTITPVLDLSEVQKNAGLIGSILGKTPAVYSYGQAQNIALTGVLSQLGTIDTQSKVTEVKFEQTINAPTQLSTAEIYRQTRNQLVLAKEELSIP